jgi:DNA repair exonuclease SbcCD nuclease subunit
MLHTADVHIGAPFEFLGAKGGDQRAAVRETFARIARMAVEGEFHLLLIAGDLFHSAYAIGERDLSFVAGALGEASEGCTVVILPGSHDYWAPGTVFEREKSRLEAGGGVHVLSPGNTTVLLPGLSAAVHGNALTAPSGTDSPLANLSPSGDVRWNIAIAHGSVEGASAAAEPSDHPICRSDLEVGFDYYALGHWHSYNVIRSGGAPVIYAGSPELIARDQKGAGSVAAVTLTAEGAAARRIRVGRRRVEAVSVDCTGLAATEELVGRIKSKMPESDDLVIELTLTGVIGSDAAIDPLLAVEELSRSYFSVRLSGGKPEREISRERLLLVPPETVAGRFVRILLERMEGSPEEERDVLTEALQLGYQLFQGRNPLG